MNAPKAVLPEIKLASLEASDAATLHQWRGDAEIRDGALAYPFPTSTDAEVAWIRSFEPKATPSDLCLAVRRCDDDRLIGYVQFRGIDWIARCAEFGIVIGVREFRGVGLGRVVLGMAMEYAFGQLALRRLWLRVVASNESAIRLYLGAGFFEEGRLRRHAFRNGKLLDVLLLGIETSNHD